MKTLTLMLGLLAGLLMPASAASPVDGPVTAISKATAAVSFAGDVEVGGFERFSIQVDFSSAPSATAGITDGAYSSATIAVVSTQALRGFRSSFTITVDNAYKLGSTSITINGKQFIEGTDWNRYAFSSTVTANNLATAINAFGVVNGSSYTATASSNVITVIAVATGSFANAWTVKSSTREALVISGGRPSGHPLINQATGYFWGGQDRGYITIAGITLREGEHFQSVTSTDATSYAIKDAINANASLAALVISSTVELGKFMIKATTSGVYAYNITVSSTNALAADYGNYTLAGGSATEVDVATNTFYEPNHSFGTGQAILFSTAAGAHINGLTFGTTYYAIRYDANRFRIATSSPNAMIGVSVDISSVNGGGSFTFAPLAYANMGGTGFLWQGSNDGISWASLPLTSDRSSFTYTQHGSTVIPFIDYPYRWLRMKFTPPSTGGLSIFSTIFGRR